LSKNELPKQKMGSRWQGSAERKMAKKVIKIMKTQNLRAETEQEEMCAQNEKKEGQHWANMEDREKRKKCPGIGGRGADRGHEEREYQDNGKVCDTRKRVAP